MVLFTGLFMFVHHVAQFSIGGFFVKLSKIDCKHLDLFLHRVVNDSSGF